MKKLIWALPLALIAFTLISCSEVAPTATDDMVAASKNGAPSGAHYNLNLIGVDKEKTADMTGDNGRRIFVALWGNTKINLCESGVGGACADVEGFQVLDANGTDGTAAFALPNPDPENVGTTRYSVFARALGKPGGKGDITTCATMDVTDELGNVIGQEEVCSLAVLELERNKGKSVFENVSKELLYIYADLDGDGTVERVNLFSDALYDYLWSYDNQGLKLVQMRFYPCPTTVPEGPDWSDPVTTACFAK